jgi:alginate O-acetyltransferase complex protein AlgI
MVFSSLEFVLCFLPLVVLATWLARRLAGARAVIALLVVASFAFYAYWDWRFLPLLLLSIAGNYLCARQLIVWEHRRRQLLIAGIAGNLLALGFFKYFNFFVENLEFVAGRDWGFASVVLPIGISFFTFQQIAYLVDVYNERRHRYALIDYALFVSFFPQLIAGPIVHHKEIMPQLQRRDLGRFDPALISSGVVVFVFGLTKKVLIADTFAGYSDPLYAAAAAGHVLSALDAWAAAGAYGLQLYFDFSGYADMAIGLGLIFGIRLPENFDRPYAALSIREFWQRWHITLSRFLRDYLYIPLGGSRVAAPRMLANLMITMILGGIWHGAGWTFLLWGMLHGSYLVTQRLFEQLRDRFGLPLLPRPVAWALTMAAVFFAWVPFRAEGLDATLNIWQGMLLAGPIMPERIAALAADAGAGPLVALLSIGGLGPNHLLVAEWLTLLPLLVACMGLAMLLPNGHQVAATVFGDGTPASALARGRLAGASTAAMLVVVLLYLTYEPVFLYFQF